MASSSWTRNTAKSFGHDLETGAPFTKEQYKGLNPAGRAILKRAHYRPLLEEPNGEYPLLLSTGRNALHFHTRTKTGRSKRLEEADPEPWVQVSTEDAEVLQLSENEMGIVKFRRGEVELPVRVGDIAQGHIFIPFHFGYWDAKDDRSRAANELTIGTSSFPNPALILVLTMQNNGTPSPSNHPSNPAPSASKKPSKKKAKKKLHAKEQQTAAIHSVETEKKQITNIPQPQTDKDSPPRVRRLELWLGATYEAMQMLIEFYDHLIPRLIHDFDVQSGLLVMHRIATELCKRFKPIVERYHESKQYGRSVAQRLLDTITPKDMSKSDPYEALAALQSLQLFLTYIGDDLVALLPASQALWDEEFLDAVKFAQGSISRQKAWASNHTKRKSPQTLLVPMAMPEDMNSPDSSLAGIMKC